VEKHYNLFRQYCYCTTEQKRLYQYDRMHVSRAWFDKTDSAQLTPKLINPTVYNWINNITRR